MLVATERKMKMDGAWLIVEPHKLYKNNMTAKNREAPRPAKRQSSARIQGFQNPKALFSMSGPYCVYCKPQYARVTYVEGSAP